MTRLTPEEEALKAATAMLRAGQGHEARLQLLALLQSRPQLAEAHRLLGLAYQLLGEAQNAEVSLRAAVAADKREPAHHVELGAFLAAEGRTKEAERAFRAALSSNRRCQPAAAQLCRLLLQQGRAQEGLQVTTPIAASPDAGEAVLAAHAQALKALGRDQEGVEALQRAVRAAPASGAAEHRLAAALSDLSRHGEAELAAQSAIRKGLDRPEAWLTLGRILQDQARFAGAEEAYRAALRRRYDHLQVQNDLAELVWMRTGDKIQALAALQEAIAAHPHEWGLKFTQARVLNYAGDAEEAYAAWLEALALAPQQPPVLTAAARAAWQAGRPEEGVRLAELAMQVQPDDPSVLGVLVQACLAAGEAQRASALAERLLAHAPLDQLSIALQATAWRMMGDARYQALYDYDAFVHSGFLAVPDGWKSLDAYLADLSETLGRLHAYKTHPFGQSVRGGSQVVLRGSAEPAVVALTQALAPPIRAAVDAIGRGEGPLRGRNTGQWRPIGMWSIRLRSAGFHDNHVHHEGWLSSACYISLPVLGDDASKAGWLKFGEPGLPTQPQLPPEHFVRPEPGKLVLFPSYMWHGTVPFTAEEPRITVAFDLVPA